MAANPATKVVESSISATGGMLSPGQKTGLAILAAFILYLLARNRLGIYLGIITG